MQYLRRDMLRLALGGAAAVLIGQAATAMARASANPTARRDHSLTADPDRGRLYLFGGRAAGRALGDVWEYDPAAQVWSELVAEGAVPEPRFGHDAFYDPVGRRLIVALGQAGPTFFDDVWSFQPEQRVWTRLDGLSEQRLAPRYGSAAGFDPTGRRLLVSHGFTNRGRFDDTWAFDIASGSWSGIETQGATPLKRCLARGAFDVASGRLLMFGGQADGRPFLGDFWSLDIASGTWSEVSQDGLPGARNLYAAATSDTGAWHLIGGNSPAGPSSEHWIYDASSSSWRLAEAAPMRVSHDAAILAGSLYAFGGTDGSTELDDLWMMAEAADRA